MKVTIDPKGMDPLRFQKLIEKSNDIVALVNRQRRVIYISPAIQRVLGYTPDEIKSLRNPFRLIHPKEVLKILKLYLLLISKKNKTVNASYRVRHKDGSYRFVETIGTNYLTDPDINAVVVNFRDVTEQMELLEKLKESEGRFHASFEQSAIPMSLADEKANWLMFNKAYSKMFGYSEEELKKMHITQLVHPDDFDKSKKAFAELIAGKINPLIQERRYIHKNGSVIYGIVHATLIKREDMPNYLVTIVEDITQRKLVDEKKDEFIGAVSHELKTPVTSLKAFAQVLERKFSKSGDEKSAQLMNKMDVQINKLTALIQDLLDFSKIESGGLQYQMKTFPIDVLIQDIVEEMQRTTEHHQILFKHKSRKNVHADRDRIGQVLINFLTNAIKYSSENSYIVVRAISNKQHVTVSVRDFGLGIPKGQLPHVFNKFFRVTGKKYDTIPGMGLGLAISSEIIKRHKGRIWVESEHGKGSCFYFSLPL